MFYRSGSHSCFKIKIKQKNGLILSLILDLLTETSKLMDIGGEEEETGLSKGFLDVQMIYQNGHK